LSAISPSHRDHDLDAVAVVEARLAKRLRGTISPLRSIARRLPASSSASTSCEKRERRREFRGRAVEMHVDRHTEFYVTFA
jgi:hypothetical protein